MSSPIKYPYRKFAAYYPRPVLEPGLDSKFANRKFVSHRFGKDGDNEDTERDEDSGLATATAKPDLKRPSMFKVILLNDDYTPMEFVVHILEKFFAMDREKATQIMLTVHTQGAATVGIFPRDIAETKSEQVNLYAQENNHPLMSKVEMTD